MSYDCNLVPEMTSRNANRFMHIVSCCISVVRIQINKQIHAQKLLIKQTANLCSSINGTYAEEQWYGQ